MTADSSGDRVLKLYVAGRTKRSDRAIRTLRQICEEDLAGRFDLIVVDILKRPHEAEAARILATPTVIRERPLPVRRVVGDLSDKGEVLAGLGLSPQSKTD